jgi:hypothetical protein
MAFGQKKEVTIVLDIRRYDKNTKEKQSFSFISVDILNERGEMIQSLLKERDINGNIKIIKFLDNMNLNENQTLFQTLSLIDMTEKNTRLFDILSIYDNVFSYFFYISKSLYNYIKSNHGIDYVVSDDKDILLSLASIDQNNNNFVYINGEKLVGFVEHATNLFLVFNYINKDNINEVQKIIEKFENQYGCDVIEVASFFYENTEKINNKLDMQVSYFFEL